MNAMSGHPDVSVIVPARNEEACLANCLGSLVGECGEGKQSIFHPFPSFGKGWNMDCFPSPHSPTSDPRQLARHASSFRAGTMTETSGCPLIAFIPSC